MKIILRKRYLDRMIALKDTPDIKIITEIRRSGKSQLMQAYAEYLRNHFNNVNIIFVDETIVTRDLVQKYHLSDIMVLQRISEFLMDNVSNLTSPNKVSNILSVNLIATNHITVGKYIRYLCNAFVFYDVKRYDIRGKKYLESLDKFYLCDGHPLCSAGQQKCGLWTHILRK